MAPNFQSSFIPKEPMTDSEVFKKKKTGLAGILALSLFILSIAGSVGVYVYKMMLNNEIQGLESQLSDAEKSIDKKTISDMSQFAQKLQITKTIVVKHEVLSNFLTMLASSTVSTVQFTEFDYGDIKDNVIPVTLKGVATNYASVALQENTFDQVKSFKSVTFSDLSLTKQGTVSFNVDIAVDPQFSLYSPPTLAVADTAPAIVLATTTATTTAMTATTTKKTTTTKTVATTTPIKH